MENNDLTKREEIKIKVMTALKNLELMGDCFAEQDADFVRGYIEMIEAENQKLKEMFVDEFGGI